MNRNLVGSIYGRSSIKIAYFVPIHYQTWQFFFLIGWFKNNFLLWNKNYLMRPCLLTDPDEMSNLYRGPAIDASYRVSVHLAEWFQRRRLTCEKLTTDAKWWRGELKSNKTWFVFSQTNIYATSYFFSLLNIKACYTITHIKKSMRKWHWHHALESLLDSNF